MSSLRILIGTIWVAILLVTRVIWTATALPRENGDPFVYDETTAVSDPHSGAAIWTEEPAPRRVDIYGNEVENAISDYRIDLRGDLYERHAPNTALPQPLPPST